MKRRIEEWQRRVQGENMGWRCGKEREGIALKGRKHLAAYTWGWSNHHRRVLVGANENFNL